VRKHRAYEGPSDEFLDRLAEPIEAAILDYIDANHDYLVQKFIQPRLKRAQAPSEEMLANLRREADVFMDNTLPQLMLDKVDIQRLGLDRFIAERLNENELARITNQALGIPGMASVTPKQVTYALRRIAARIDASEKPSPKLVSRDLETVLKALL
jgi:RNase adaptor protein for sRNA GlmZ degradation